MSTTTWTATTPSTAASRDFDAARSGDAIVHGFSHYRLRIHPHRIGGVRARAAVGDNQDLRWAARAELAAIGLPAPVRRLLQDPLAEG